MNAHIQILIDTESLKKRISSNTCKVDGNIWVRINSRDLPSKGWFDYPFAILSWWLAETAKFAEGHAAKADWLFMDGPCYIRLTGVEGESQRWRMRFFADDSSPAIIDEIVMIMDVLRSLHNAAESILAFCLQKDWRQVLDLSELEKGLRLVRDAARNREQ